MNSLPKSGLWQDGHGRVGCRGGQGALPTLGQVSSITHGRPERVSNLSLERSLADLGQQTVRSNRSQTETADAADGSGPGGKRQPPDPTGRPLQAHRDHHISLELGQWSEEHPSLCRLCQ